MGDATHFIPLYFYLGFSNREILTLLANLDGLFISMSTLKRKLKSLGLFRRKKYSDLLDVADFIIAQLETSGALHGYRWMHLKCKQSGYNIPRDTIYQLMQLLDPNGMHGRKRRRLMRRKFSSPGPNYVWHVDSYDKLKPYGIAINGCIDGYSRYIIWLEAATTNSDPKVIASYFIESVRKRGGCPKRIRSDLGNENIFIENMQIFLRGEHRDDFAGEKSFLSGKSTHNQRIEWFWGLLRKEMGQYFMDLFSELEKDINDLFCGDLLDKSLIQFCFLEIIQVTRYQLIYFLIPHYYECDVL
jgi:hypothetical protein